MIEINNKAYAIFVVICYVIMIIINGLSATAFASFGGLDNATISNTNPTYLTPDGLTFAIWAIIYIGEAAFSIYQVLPSNHDNDEFVVARPYVLVAFLLNSIWLVIFSLQLWWLSTFIIAAYLLALVWVYRSLNINYSSDKSIVYKLCSFVGFSCNVAWVTVATVLNLTVTLRNNGYITAASVNIGANVDWAIAFIVLVAVISSSLSFYELDVAHNLTTAWALSGIIRMQTTPNAVRFPVNMLSAQISNWALACEILVLVCAFIAVIAKVIESRFVNKGAERV